VQFVGGDGGPTISQGTELATMLLSAACQIKVRAHDTRTRAQMHVG
jgi:hypothetical protein